MKPRWFQNSTWSFFGDTKWFQDNFGVFFLSKVSRAFNSCFLAKTHNTLGFEITISLGYMKLLSVGIDVTQLELN